MIVAGLGGSVHDFATAVADENEIVCAIEDERITRIRHAVDSKDPLRPSWSYCVEALQGVEPTRIVANDTLRHVPMLADRNVEWRSHHLTHAASVFYTSPFESAAVLVVDGAGSVVADLGSTHTREATSVYFGEGNRLALHLACEGTKECPATVNDFEHTTSNSLGDLYEWVTTEIGFRPLQEGKTMALAALGDDRFVRAIGERCAIDNDFRISININGGNGLREWAHGIRSATGELSFDLRAALAFAAQATLERLFAEVARQAHRTTRSQNVCIAGGVGLNAVLMGKLADLTPFERVHLISAPGDSGTAIGAALLPHVADASDVKRWSWSPYLGRRHSIDPKLLRGLAAQRARNDAELLSRTIAELNQGKVGAIFRGPSEFGPRALGNRSIVAWASQDGILHKLNKLKGREWYRPIAPVTHRSGQTINASGERWMQMARQNAGGDWPRAALHIDGSARVQLIDGQMPDQFYCELARYGDTPGIGPLLNTSFNINAEPIVETPADALDAFHRSDIDFLILQDWVIVK